MGGGLEEGRCVGRAGRAAPGRGGEERRGEEENGVGGRREKGGGLEGEPVREGEQGESDRHTAGTLDRERARGASSDLTSVSPFAQQVGVARGFYAPPPHRSHRIASG
ncbi:hypothetical protein DAEQUDRAFT_221184 [Daedalea quercina L-15889]|uniref:Uncharacterized protein n=1 Tax=Daedalea quercina L-15889 TaxID=1314783 RepID=A0A165R6T8_9APHY|nr:hypothetical protein DAEQUDRAFT_221184 [Daedalea quercina L-15889]